MMPVPLSLNHLEYMNIGRRFYEAKVEGFTSSQFKQIKKYLDNLEIFLRRGVGMFLWGKNSVGKSYVAAALCKKVWRDYRIASYCVTASELKDAWTSPRDSPAHPGSDELMSDRVDQVRFLVIDDVGKEHRTSSGFSESQFGRLLRSRVRDRLVTILTLNLSLQGFTRIYGESAAKLLQESAIEVCLDGPDMRGKIAGVLASVADGEECRK